MSSLIESLHTFREDSQLATTLAKAPLKCSFVLLLFCISFCKWQAMRTFAFLFAATSFAQNWKPNLMSYPVQAVMIRVIKVTNLFQCKMKRERKEVNDKA